MPAKAERRVNSISDMPMESLLCVAFGHSWGKGDAVAIAAPDWGKVAATYELRCACGRTRRDVFNIDTMELMYRDYDGGVLFEPGAWEPRHVARGEWFRRIRRAQMAAERDALANRNTTSVAVRPKVAAARKPRGGGR